MSQNRDEDRAVELRSARDAYGTKQATADDQTKRDNAHFMRLLTTPFANGTAAVTDRLAHARRVLAYALERTRTMGDARVQL